MADINSTLRKIKALAEGTANEHEREAALAKFYELMDLHGISESDIADEATEIHVFKWRNKRDRKLLLQITSKVMESNNLETYCYRRYGRKISGEMGIECTIAQKLEIDFMFGFYKNLYRREEEVFYSAFIQKHKIFGPPSGEGREVSGEEILKMRQLMEGMENATPHKHISVSEEE